MTCTRAVTLLPILLGVLGPVSALAAQTTTATLARDPEVLRLQAHYERVEQELRARDCRHLTPVQRAERARLIDVLHAYWKRGDFGINRDFPGERKPYFVDFEGRRCAVANLMDHSGFGAVTIDVARHANHAWVVELRSDARLRDWLRASGFTLEEAARIQGPGRRRRGFIEAESFVPAWQRRVESAAPTAASAVRDARRSAAGEGRAASPSTAGDRVGRNGRVSRSPAQRFARSSLEDAIDWRDWWHLGKREFLRPGKFSVSKRTRPGTSTVEPVAIPGRAELRARLLDVAREALDDPQSAVRGAAARALGRIGDDSDIVRLEACLRDPQAAIREDAILALGALATGRSVHALLRTLARDAIPVTRTARPLAIIALGLARRSGSDADTSAVVASVLRSTHLENREVSSAAMLYQQLTPGDELAVLARELEAEKRQPDDVRVRALEALQVLGDRGHLVRMTRALSGRRIDRRQSAAVALGHVDDVLALPPLMTAFELEREPLTKGLIALAIGRQGGPEARELLLTKLRRAPRAQRTWCALALALHSRRDPDSAIRRAIREARQRARNQEHVAAYLVASGIARDTEAVPGLVRDLFEGKSALIRTSAAEALAMIGGRDAREALLARVDVDGCRETRAVIAQVLGLLGHAGDAARIAGVLDKTKNPSVRAGLATALGYLGHVNACRMLEKIIDDPAESPMVRAAAIEGIACSVSDKPSFVLASLVPTSNFVGFPAWLERFIWSSL